MKKSVSVFLKNNASRDKATKKKLNPLSNRGKPNKLDKNRADDQVGPGAGAGDVELGGQAGADRPARDLLDVAHARGVDVEHGDVGPHARAHPRCG